MKKHKAGLIFVSGLAAGLGIALCLGAVEKPNEPPKNDWSRLKMWGYPNGTGIFDPSNGVIYVYDAELRNCFLARRIVALGLPLR